VATQRFIIADDDQEMRRVLRAILRPLGAEIVEAANGADLLGVLTKGGPCDLVITDMRMPSASGLDAMMTARTAGYETPFILITAFGDDEVRAALRRVPNAFLLAKPFAPPALLDSVATALGNREPTTP
jgi:CheY-like chemotaxis protein